MPIFTIVAAHPVDVQSHELPRVRVDTFILSASSLIAAYAEIKEWAGIVDATEVFGIKNAGLMITPDSALRREEPLEQWQHWSRAARAGEMMDWGHLADGVESFQQRQDRIVGRLVAEREAAIKASCVQHTPGPWYATSFVEPSDATRIYTVWGNGGAVAKLTYGCHGSGDDDVRTANSRLIATAPDLLAALQALAQHAGPYIPRSPSLAQAYTDACAVIDKATGSAS